MITSWVIAGFMMGILGSFHCIGMCGPIALALPVGNATKWKRMLYILLYNTGRASAYAIIGVLFGLLGKQLFIGGYQQWLSILLGVVMLSLFFFSKYLNGKVPFFDAYTGKLKSFLVKLFKSEKHVHTFWLIGFLNGFLPCGLVYVAVAAAVASGDVWHSMFFMMAFGLGTFPVMVAVIAAGKYISVQWRNQMRKAVPVFVTIMAVLLILRGLNLGIPYISPEMTATPTGTHSCCHK